MNIIFISNAGNRSFRVTVKRFVFSVCVGLFVLFAGVIFYAGYEKARLDSVSVLDSARYRTASAWDTELKEQKKTLQDLKLRTEKSLDAMAGRLSLLQAYVVRLDALGSRLATMADLDDMEFGIENPPGIGGPFADIMDSEILMSDLHSEFIQLEHTLKDRAEKLTVMETMLINRTLQEQISPGSKPTLGGYISSLFGRRTDPLTGRMQFHEGIDFAGKSGAPIHAAGAGIITWSGSRYGYGKLVEISHGNGYITRYAHNKRNLVSVGDKVEKGEVIALMGSTGRSTGTHVHFEVIHNGRHVDPIKYLSLK